jgi:nucleoid DNA-binding protein
MAQKKASPKSPSKTEIYNNIAEATELSKKQVDAVFKALEAEIEKALGKKGNGVFQLPGIVKLTVKDIPATKAGMRKDPFTGQERMFPAKPARKSVRARPLKKIKDMVA